MEQQQKRVIRGARGTRAGGAANLRDILMLATGAVLSATLVLTLQVGNSVSSSTSLQSVAAGGPTSTRPGWNPIHVFYGKMNHLVDPIPDKWWLKDSPAHQTGKQWFSQHGQDVAVAKVFNFKKGGFFVDLAANDAVWASNTFALEQNFGWKGICIEANPIYWYRLSFRKCHAVGSIVGGKDFEEIKVALGSRKEMGPFGGIVGKDFDNKKVKESEAELRYTASLKTILEMFDAPKIIDFLSLDVEGAELFIMKDFPFEEYTFLSMTVERPSEELQAIFKKYGYEKAMDIKRGDTLWVHKTMLSKAQKNLAKNPEEIDKHEVNHLP